MSQKVEKFLRKVARVTALRRVTHGADLSTIPAAFYRKAAQEFPQIHRQLRTQWASANHRDRGRLRFRLKHELGLA